MTVKRNKKDQVVITLDSSLDEKIIQRIIDRCLLEELARKSKKVSQKQVNDLADKITMAYWERVKNQFRAEGRH